MGGLGGWLRDTFSSIPIVNTVLGAIGDVIEFLWTEVADPILEFIFSLLGIVDQDIVSVFQSSQRLLPDENIGKLIQQATLNKVLKDTPVLTSLMLNYSEVKAKYTKFYDKGSTTFVDGIPDSSLNGRGINTGALTTVLNSLNGQSNTVTLATMRVPLKNEWVGYQLQQLYNYTPYNNKLLYNGSIHRVMNIDYDYVSNSYDVDISRFETVVENTYTNTVYTVVNKNATTDTVIKDVYDRLEVIKELSGTTITDTFVSTETYDVPIGTVINESVLVLVDTMTYEAIYSSAVINVTSYAPVQMYVVKYEWISGEWRWWVYDPATNVYPELATTRMHVKALEMLPIVSIRNNKVNVTSDPNSDRYKSSQEILKDIGINIEQVTDAINQSPDIANITDAFVYFGINPHDMSPIISKTLYMMADVMYSDESLKELVEAIPDPADPVSGADTVYSFSIKEGAFNQVAKWDTQSRTIVNGVIGPVDTYNHAIAGTTLIMRKQETPTQYVEYAFTKVTSITHISWGGNGGVATMDINSDRAASNFIVPLSMEFVRNLTGREQVELFVKALRLTVYGGTVTHLEWYETQAFADILQVISIGVAVVLFIVTLPAGGTGGIAWESLVTGLLISAGTTIALKLILQGGAPEWLKAVAMIAYVAAMFYAGGGFDADFGLLEAAQLVSLTSNASNMYIESKASVLQKDIGTFQSSYEQRQNELEEKRKSLELLLDPTAVAGMVRATTISPSTYYDIAKGKYLYDNSYMGYASLYKLDTAYNYSNKFTLGIK